MEHPTESTDEEFLTVDQIAKHLKVSRDTVELLIKTKQLRAKKIGRMWRIRKQWFEAFIDDKPQEGE